MPERIQGAVVTPSLFPLLGRCSRSRPRFQRQRIWRRQRRRGRGQRAALAAAVQFRSAARRHADLAQRPQLHRRRDHAGEVRIPAAAFWGAGRHVRRAGRHLEADRFHARQELESRGSRSYGVIGRLKPGVPLAQAQAEVDTIIANWYPLFPDNYVPATTFRRHALSDSTNKSSAECERL